MSNNSSICIFEKQPACPDGSSFFVVVGFVALGAFLLLSVTSLLLSRYARHVAGKSSYESTIDENLRCFHLLPVCENILRLKNICILLYLIGAVAIFSRSGHMCHSNVYNIYVLLIMSLPDRPVFVLILSCATKTVRQITAFPALTS